MNLTFPNTAVNVDDGGAPEHLATPFRQSPLTPASIPPETPRKYSRWPHEAQCLSPS